jgi:YebC/PmpR family DNA-binding regulatory protein
MSGHSKWATIKRAKGANDAKRGAIFTKLGNQIAIAARMGTDPTMNSSLAMIIEKAKSANMPKESIKRAIDRVSDKNAAVLDEMTYEAYGPGGVGILIEAATDNKNRTLPEIKNTLTKNGGRIAEPGSVAFQFERKGILRLESASEDDLLQIIDAGAEDASEQEGRIMVTTNPKELAKVRDHLVAAGFTVSEAGLEYVPKTSVSLDDEETERKILKLFDALDDLDDVINVSSNADFS